MKIGIISDTHEQVANINKAVKILKERDLDIVIHCGDVISGAMLPLFKGLNMRIILGNNNSDQDTYDMKTEELGFEKITMRKEFTVEEKSFLVDHGRYREFLDDAVRSQKYDYVLTGHTHKRRDERFGRTRVINPGSLFTDDDNSVAVLDLDDDLLEFIKV